MLLEFLGVWNEVRHSLGRPRTILFPIISLFFGLYFHIHFRGSTSGRTSFIEFKNLKIIREDRYNMYYVLCTPSFS